MGVEFALRANQAREKRSSFVVLRGPRHMAPPLVLRRIGLLGQVEARFYSWCLGRGSATSPTYYALGDHAFGMLEQALAVVEPRATSPCTPRVLGNVAARSRLLDPRYRAVRSNRGCTPIESCALAGDGARELRSRPAA